MNDAWNGVLEMVPDGTYFVGVGRTGVVADVPTGEALASALFSLMTSSLAVVGRDMFCIDVLPLNDILSGGS